MRHAGTTLVELLVSLSIIVLISGAVFAVYLTSMGLWRRVSSSEQAMPAAYQVSTRLAQELKNACAVSVNPTGTRLTCSMPKIDSDGFDVLPVQAGREVTYYLADATGDDATTGAILWRKQKDLTTHAVTQMKLANNVTELQFVVAASDTGRVFAVYTTAITVVSQEGIVSATSRFTTAAAIRCAMATP
jgi:type II secretory pathway pseudopilin PulG